MTDAVHFGKGADVFVETRQAVNTILASQLNIGFRATTASNKHRAATHLVQSGRSSIALTIGTTKESSYAGLSNTSSSALSHCPDQRGPATPCTKRKFDSNEKCGFSQPKQTDLLRLETGSAGALTARVVAVRWRVALTSMNTTLCIGAGAALHRGGWRPRQSVGSSHVGRRCQLPVQNSLETLTSGQQLPVCGISGDKFMLRLPALVSFQYKPTGIIQQTAV